MLCLRSVIVTVLVCGAAPALAATPRKGVNAVSVRIHDYATVDGRQLRRAERQVTATFARIGVRLDWSDAVRAADVEAGTATWPTSLVSVTINLLAADMWERLGKPHNVAGFAPITRDQGGSIAYVAGDRIREIAEAGRVAQSDVLAIVMAHELAHLLLPEGSHSSDGVMRANWQPTEFKHSQRRRFAAAEGSSIRQIVRVLGVGALQGANQP